MYTLIKEKRDMGHRDNKAEIYSYRCLSFLSPQKVQYCNQKIFSTKKGD